MWYVADGCINGGKLAYLSLFTIVRGVMEHLIEIMEHLIENNVTLQRE